MKVVASGKVFLFGEYAVLEGAPALVMAVDRYAHARAVASDCEASELWRWTVQAFRSDTELSPLLPARTGEGEGAPAFDFASLPRSVVVDTHRLSDGAVKLGLGSSAAACVTLAATCVWRAGHSLASDEARRRIFRVARAVHDRLQGERGSGADVAAAVEGGLLRYEIAAGGRFSHLRLPVPLRLLFVPTGVAASTRLFLAKVRELRGAQPDAYHRRLRVLGELATELCTELESRPAADVCLLVHSYVAHLDALGHDAGVPIVSEPHRRIVALARQSGCAAKPSGAGGGDLAVVFCPDGASALAARAALAAAGFPTLELEPDGAGVRLERDDDRDEARTQPA